MYLLDRGAFFEYQEKIHFAQCRNLLLRPLTSLFAPSEHPYIQSGIVSETIESRQAHAVVQSQMAQTGEGSFLHPPFVYPYIG